jgi:hypothetical protein
MSKEDFKEKEKLVTRVPDGRLTPGQTGRLTVGRKLTSTLTSAAFQPVLGLLSVDTTVAGS